MGSVFMESPWLLSLLTLVVIFSSSTKCFFLFTSGAGIISTTSGHQQHQTTGDSKQKHHVEECHPTEGQHQNQHQQQPQHLSPQHSNNSEIHGLQVINKKPNAIAFVVHSTDAGENHQPSEAEELESYFTSTKADAVSISSGGGGDDNEKDQPPARPPLPTPTQHSGDKTVGGTAGGGGETPGKRQGLIARWFGKMVQWWRRRCVAVLKNPVVRLAMKPLCTALRGRETEVRNHIRAYHLSDDPKGLAMSSLRAVCQQDFGANLSDGTRVAELQRKLDEALAALDKLSSNNANNGENGAGKKTEMETHLNPKAATEESPVERKVVEEAETQIDLLPPEIPNNPEHHISSSNGGGKGGIAHKFFVNVKKVFTPGWLWFHHGKKEANREKKIADEKKDHSFHPFSQNKGGGLIGHLCTSIGAKLKAQLAKLRALVTAHRVTTMPPTQQLQNDHEKLALEVHGEMDNGKTEHHELGQHQIRRSVRNVFSFAKKSPQKPTENHTKSDGKTETEAEKKRNVEWARNTAFTLFLAMLILDTVLGLVLAALVIIAMNIASTVITHGGFPALLMVLPKAGGVAAGGLQLLIAAALVAGIGVLVLPIVYGVEGKGVKQ